MPFDPSAFDPSAIPFFQITFWAMTLCAIGGAIGVVSSRNLFHSALFLILSLFGIGGYYVLLSAGFLAVVQLLVYIGAIVVLILFAIMFSHQATEPGENQNNHQWWFSLPIAIILFFILFGVVSTFNWPTSETEPSQDTVLQLGRAFLGSYLIPFMVVSILLSVTLIGAIFLAREKTEVEEAAQ